MVQNFNDGGPLGGQIRIIRGFAEKRLIPRVEVQLTFRHDVRTCKQIRQGEAVDFQQLQCPRQRRRNGVDAVGDHHWPVQQRRFQGNRATSQQQRIAGRHQRGAIPIEAVYIRKCGKQCGTGLIWRLS